MTPSNRGGLSISHLNYFNVALIIKWIFKFTNERDSLWKRVVCAKSGADPSRMLLVVF